MKIAIASDHAGYELKVRVFDYLKAQGHTQEDFGCPDKTPIDYIDTGQPAAESVARRDHDIGILICGTGQGMSIIANKVKGTRAALCHTSEFAVLAREHNDANVLVLAGRYIKPELAFEIVDSFMKTDFSNAERHINRINKITKYENK